MKQKQLLLMCCAVITAAWSCSKNGASPGSDNSLRVDLNIVSNMTTRASASAEENAVASFDLYVFDTASGILEFKQQVTAAAPVPGNVAGEQKLAEVNLTLKDGNEKNILAIANSVGGSVSFPSVSVGTTTYGEMLEAVAFLEDGNRPPSHPFVMGGYLNRVKAGGQSAATVSLSRRVSKLVVSNQSADDGLEISELQLSGVVSQSYLFRNGHPDLPEYVDYDVVAVTDNTPVVLYVFPQPAATNRMRLTVKGKLNGIDFLETMDVKPMKDGIPQDMDNNTLYSVKLTAGTQAISMEVIVQSIEDWGDGEDMPCTIGGGEPGSAGLISFNGLQWMDRNLGATSADIETDWDNAIGFFYQWGRNAAFTSTQAIETISGPVTAEVAEANPDKFIKKMNGDWLDGTDNTRWQTIDKQPCPDGYRMPTIADFTAIFTPDGILVNMYNPPVTKSEDGHSCQYYGDKGSVIYGIKKAGTAEAYYLKWEWLKTAAGNGYVKISRWDADASATFLDKDLAGVQDEFAVLGEAPQTIIFPAAGNIIGSGGYYSEGSPGGYYWTSSLNGGGAHRMEITSGKMISGATYNSRVSGHSIRCVKE